VAVEAPCVSATGAAQSYVHVARLVESRSDRRLAARDLPAIDAEEAAALRVLAGGGDLERRRRAWIATAAGDGPIEARRRRVQVSVRAMQRAGLVQRRGAAVSLTALGAAVARSLDG